MNPGLRHLLELILTTVSFTITTDSPLYLWTWNSPLLHGALFWAGMFLRSPERRISDLLQKAFAGAGLVFLYEALISYIQEYPTHSISSILMGSALALALLVVVQYLFVPPATVGRALMIGTGPWAAQHVALHRLPIDGLYDVEPSALVPEIPYLGPPPASASALLQEHPQTVVAADPAALALTPKELAKLRFAGVRISSLSQFYEKQLRRVCYWHMEPLDFVLTGSFSANAFAMALQSVYNNLIGLSLLLAVMPLLIPLSILVAFSGPGPVFEILECAGLQQIPFHRLRFRTRRGDTGEVTAIGRWLMRFRLDSLPQLINLVRGEMALFGPSPIRIEFASRLSQCFPFYFHRFAVRPGIFGWGQMNLGDQFAVTSEYIRLEYDLYYVRHASVALDFEVLWKTIASWLRGSRSRPK